ncbi:PEP-CTERM sorting domain-containing protein [Fundidesulfovibrio terrae]|uniref:PEP-CTERM sorting domain-containing protein n=1 Tax=Fundidesulfovibrio terrae TaxID=2922866 RepID=UPI001FAF8EE0|nr:PEP-CTERM sorting domain-containing protein [Fundidesulfovibrio terrae]
MKTSSSTILGFALLVLCLTSAQASAVSFSDPAKVWPGLKHTPELSTQDQNGVPDLTGGTFTYDKHVLTAITLNYTDLQYNTPGWNGLWNGLAAGDWYFDVDNDNAWDYVIHKASSSSGYHLYESSDKWKYGTATLYDANGHFTQYNAFYGGTENRDWHPTTIQDTTLPYSTTKKHVTTYYNTDVVDLGSVSYDGWDKIDDLTKVSSSVATGSSTWDLSKTLYGGIDLNAFKGQNINFGFTMVCANDVLFDHTRVPTPEPGTMLLMGAGALCAGLARARKRFFRQ